MLFLVYVLLVLSERAVDVETISATTASGPIIDLGYGLWQAKINVGTFTALKTSCAAEGSATCLPQNTSAFNDFITASVLPDAQPSVLDLVENTIYPPIFDNKIGLGYNDTITRLATLVADMTLNCNVYALLEAFGANKTSAYLFDEGPSLHGEETPYTFYDYGPTPDAYGFGLVNGTVAKTLQDWIVNFVATGDPNGQGIPGIPVYGEKRIMGLLSNQGLGLQAADPAGQERCEFWNKALYF